MSAIAWRSQDESSSHRECNFRSMRREVHGGDEIILGLGVHSDAVYQNGVLYVLGQAKLGAALEVRQQEGLQPPVDLVQRPRLGNAET